MYATAVRPWAWVGPQQGASQPGRERERERESGRWRAGDRGEEPGSTVALRLAGQQANRLLVARSSGAVLLCAADTGQVLARYPACQGNHILGVAVTPDARSLCVLSGSERAVKVFELQTAALRTQIASQHSRFYGLAAAADNDTLCIGCDGAVELASISRGCVVAQLLGHTKSVNALMAVPGQLQLLSGSFDGTIRLWDLPSRRCTAVLRGHTSGTYSFALSADRRWLFSSGLDCTVRCWDLHTFQCVGVMANHERAVLALALTPMGDLLYSLDARVINVWRTKDLSCVGRLPHRGWRCMAISADGRYLYADGRPRDGWCPIDITVRVFEGQPDDDWRGGFLAWWFCLAGIDCNDFRFRVAAVLVAGDASRP